MKLLSFRRPDGDPSWGIAKDEGVIDLGHLAPSLKHAIWASTSLAELASRHADYKLSDVRFLPPIPDPDKILCVGLNYVSHIKEGGREPPPKPIIFARFANSQVGHGETLIRAQGVGDLRLRRRTGGRHRPALPPCAEGKRVGRDRRVRVLQRRLGARMAAAFRAVHPRQKFLSLRRLRPVDRDAGGSRRHHHRDICSPA